MLAILFHVWLAHANTQKNLDAIGVHYPILTVEKNENPQNIMVIYTKLNKQCHILNDPEDDKSPVFSFYWLMDRQRYKRVHPLIRRGIQKRLQIVNRQENSFTVALNDLKELNSDLSKPVFLVRAIDNKGQCEVQTSLTLGPSEQNAQMRLNSIYSEARKTFWPPFRKLLSVTLEGENVKTGAKIKKTFKAPAAN